MIDKTTINLWGLNFECFDCFTLASNDNEKEIT
jgi:hypothetical protein